MKSYQRQVITVFLFELAIISVMALVAYGFWETLCADSWHACLGPEDSFVRTKFLFLAIIRPFLFTPIMIMGLVGGSSFGVIEGTLLTALGAALSSLVLFLPGAYLGKRLVRPWLSANLPATWQLIRTQDYKVAFILRWIPFFPFDVCSILFGVANFHTRRVFIATFIGVIPEAYVFASLASTPGAAITAQAVLNLLIFGVLTTLPLLVYEFIFRKQGSSLWMQLKRTYYEILYELRVNNDIVKRHEFSGDKIPVILLYGFFSSRRSLTVIERLLTQRGFQVMSFNLGGAFGVFFTRGIKETAEFVNSKILRQIERHRFQKVHVIGHSKGGLVALWWLLKLGGHRYCDRVITLGSPFKGSWVTYLGLMTPLGFLWPDLWQMRPGSELLLELQKSTVPNDVSIYCCYSEKDRVTIGDAGIFEPAAGSERVVPVPMHHISHFEYLYRRDVGDSLAKLLRTPTPGAGQAVNE